MADSTTLLEQIQTSQSQKEVTANQLFDSMSMGASYGRHAEACSGLVWGYYGTRFGGTAVANGTNTCGNNATTYMVAHLTTGAVTFATSTTNWNDATTYGRCYKIVTGAASVSSYEDHRFGPLGIILAAVTAGTGTVTHSAGALTANALVLGAGLADTKVVAGLTTDGTSAVNLGVIGASVGKVVLANATSGTITLQPQTGALGTVVATIPAESFTFGYINVPQVSKSGPYTTVMSDQGKHILHPAADGTARIFTIDSNANVPYAIGTAITFVNENSAGAVTIAITTDTMRLAGAGTTGSRTLAANGVATALKITSTSWIISGTGLT